jgi:dihydroorotase
VETVHPVCYCIKVAASERERERAREPQNNEQQRGHCSHQSASSPAPSKTYDPAADVFHAAIPLDSVISTIAVAQQYESTQRSSDVKE